MSRPQTDMEKVREAALEFREVVRTMAHQDLIRMAKTFNAIGCSASEAIESIRAFSRSAEGLLVPPNPPSLRERIANWWESKQMGW